MNYKYTMELKKGDTAPAISIQIIKESTNLPLDLTSATAAFYMIKKGESTFKVNGVAASIIDAPNGIVTYNWGANDTDTVGEYEAEFKVTLSGGAKASFPPSGSLIVKVTSISSS